MSWWNYQSPFTMASTDSPNRADRAPPPGAAGTITVVPDSTQKVSTATTDYAQEQYTELNEKYKKMYQDNGKTVTENTRLTTQVDTLTTQVNTLTKQVTTLEKRTVATKKWNDLCKRFNKLQTEADEMKEESDKMKAEWDDEKVGLTEYNKMVNRHNVQYDKVQELVLELEELKKRVPPVVVIDDNAVYNANLTRVRESTKIISDVIVIDEVRNGTE